MLKRRVLLLSNIALADVITEISERDIPCRLRIQGSSMLPFIKSGDIVTVVPIDISTHIFAYPAAILMPHMQRCVIHRIVGRKKKGFLLKGDYSFKNDGMFNREDILGVVTKIERKGRAVTLGLRWERYIIAILSRWYILPFLAKSLYAIRDWKRSAKIFM